LEKSKTVKVGVETRSGARSTRRSRSKKSATTKMPVTKIGQLEMLRRQPSAYGGELLKKRKGRARGGRPLATRTSMHLVLRSTKAVGEWSFKKKNNESRIETIITRFAIKYGIHIYSLANVGNHLHLHIRIGNRYTYRPFIRAITSAIATAVTGTNRWNTMRQQFLRKQTNGLGGRGVQDHHSQQQPHKKCIRFWDYRPFTRIVEGFRAFLNLRDYIQVNRLEGFGHTRGEARMILLARDNDALGKASGTTRWRFMQTHSVAHNTG
jgi:hypothetical protein